MTEDIEDTEITTTGTDQEEKTMNIARVVIIRPQNSACGMIILHRLVMMSAVLDDPVPARLPDVHNYLLRLSPPPTDL